MTVVGTPEKIAQDQRSSGVRQKLARLMDRAARRLVTTHPLGRAGGSPGAEGLPPLASPDPSATLSQTLAENSHEASGPAPLRAYGPISVAAAKFLRGGVANRDVVGRGTGPGVGFADARNADASGGEALHSIQGGAGA